MEIRTLIDLVEAAYHGASTYWFHPETKEVIPVSDHGTAVIDNPEHFDVEANVQYAMERAYPYGFHDDDDADLRSDDDDDPDDPVEPLPRFIREELPQELQIFGQDISSEQGQSGGVWYANDAWEQLAMNRNWVRVGEGGGHQSYTYVSSCAGAPVWHAIKFIAEHGDMGKGAEIEISRPQDALFLVLSLENIERFIKAGPNRADAFLQKFKT